MEQLDRAIGILKSPQTELTKVKSEEMSKDYLIKQYIAILAVIPAIAYIIGYGVVGGIPVLMETPKDKAMTYAIVVIVAMVVIYFIMGAIASGIVMSISPVPGMMGAPYR